MAISPVARAEAQRLSSLFRASGATEVTADILQPAETLLDLYGENIRHRAYVTADPLRGEMMMRPDFTVPVVLDHLARGAGTARYTYSGEVFRKQIDDPDAPNEYLQVGYEVFGGTGPAEADAEVFALFADILAPYRARAATGDMGVLTAAVQGLTTTDRRKSALLRHIWRPRRFRALFDRFAGRTPAPSSREEVLAMDDPASVISEAGVAGLRSAAEILERIEALREDADAPPIPMAEVEVLDDILNLRQTAPFALEKLRDIAVDLPKLTPALDRLDARLSAMSALGVDIETLDFEASYGRSTLEYYDGFVFGFSADGRADLPPLASGGRYDALTAVLGQGRAVPAVGGIIRPALLAEIAEGLA